MKVLGQRRLPSIIGGGEEVALVKRRALAVTPSSHDGAPIENSVAGLESLEDPAVHPRQTIVQGDAPRYACQLVTFASPPNAEISDVPDLVGMVQVQCKSSGSVDQIALIVDYEDDCLRLRHPSCNQAARSRAVMIQIFRD